MYYDIHKKYKVKTSKVLEWLAKVADHPEYSTSKLSTSTILRLARQIVAFKPELIIDLDIIYTLEDVIKARKDLNRFLSSLHTRNNGMSNNNLVASDHKHRHFIGVLEETLQILKSHLKRQRVIATVKIPQEIKQIRARRTNIYDNLPLEGLEEEDDIDVQEGSDRG